MIEIARRVQIKDVHIPVDDWDTEKYPISEADRIFKNSRGEIILPIAEFMLGGVTEENKQINYFAMNSKRSYNSDETRQHICRYLNYFIKYYDFDKELLSVIYRMKVLIDYNKSYSKANFMADINRYIINNTKLNRMIKRFVDDNYTMNLSSNNNKTPNLQFENKHAKILLEISLMMNMYIPLATHYMYLHFIKKSIDVQSFMLELFDMCNTHFENERNISIYDKMYETATSVVNKSKSPDAPLWAMNAIRGINTTTHTKESVTDIILQIIPKYDYRNNIINFNYFSNRQCLKFKITDIRYEYPFFKLSSSKRDADQNSEYDKFEARLNKKDEALFLQNKVAAEQAVVRIEQRYGPFSDDEIEFYRRKLTKDGRAVINPFQMKMVAYLFCKEFGDPATIKAINQIDYIKLIIASKKLLLNSGMVILPYILSSRVTRTTTRKNVNKKELIRVESSESYDRVKAKYNNPNLEQRILEIIGQIISSTFEIIDYDADHKCPTSIDGTPVPIINDIINEEVLLFVNMI